MNSIRHFENNNRRIIIWLVRVFISIIFTLSAILKLFPIELFEKQLVTISSKPGVLFEFTNWCTAPTWARFIIILELFLGLSFLIPHYQKKITIPFSISILFLFIIHLSYHISIYGNIGNCGCMGEKISMTPLSGIIKNILMILLMIYLFIHTKKQIHETFVFQFYLIPIVILPVFVFFPIKNNCNNVTIESLNNEVDFLNARIDTLSMILNTKNNLKPNNIYKPILNVKHNVSEFHDFKQFEFNGKLINVNLDDKKNIVCVFNPDCDHCINLAKKIKEINVKKKIIDFYFLFCNPDLSDDSNLFELKIQISNFMKKSGVLCPTKVIDIESFNQLLNVDSPPRLTILENGNKLFNFAGSELIDFDKVLKLAKKNISYQ